MPDGRSCASVGNGNPWIHGSIDPDLGLFYITFGDAKGCRGAQDGQLRPGLNLFANSLVALDLKTGTYKWHFQSVHHDLWDMDNVHAPLLADVSINGQTRRAIYYGSKSGHLMVLDRATGLPLLPIEERPVPVDSRQAAWPTQPFPTPSIPRLRRLRGAGSEEHPGGSVPGRTELQRLSAERGGATGLHRTQLSRRRQALHDIPARVRRHASPRVPVRPALGPAAALDHDAERRRRLVELFVQPPARARLLPVRRQQRRALAQRACQRTARAWAVPDRRHRRHRRRHEHRALAQPSGSRYGARAVAGDDGQRSAVCRAVRWQLPRDRRGHRQRDLAFSDRHGYQQRGRHLHGQRRAVRRDVCRRHRHPLRRFGDARAVRCGPSSSGAPIARRRAAARRRRPGP
jgi:hypothetical protein